MHLAVDLDMMQDNIASSFWHKDFRFSVKKILSCHVHSVVDVNSNSIKFAILTKLVIDLVIFDRSVPENRILLLSEGRVGGRLIVAFLPLSRNITR